MPRVPRYLLLALLAAVAITSFVVFRNRAGAGADADASKPLASKRAPTVSACVVEPEPFSEALMLTGVVSAAEQVEIRAEVSGRIMALEFGEGARVGAGQVLVRMNDAEQRARLDRLRAQFQVDSAQFQRLESLRKIDGASVQELDAARAQVQMRKAEMAEAMALLEKTTLRAPFAGVMGLRMVSTGAVISPQTLISTLADVSSLKIDVPVPDRYANAVTVGTVLRCVKRSNLGTDTILATVYATEPTLEEATRTLRVRARLASGARAVPGTIVDVILQTAAASNALLVPTEAVQPGMKGSSVFVVNNGIAREVPVVLGGRTERRVHVLEGLRTGDTVATSGLLILKSGMPALATVSARQ